MRSNIRVLTETALCTALIAVSAMISIPFSVPFTLQIFGIYFALFFLGGGRGALATLLYVLIGAVGLPVFSGFSGGIGRLFDAAGGFIWGFLLLTLVYLVCELAFARYRWGRAFAAVISLVAFYAIGSVWYAAFYTDGGIGNYFASLMITVAPFLLPDIVKICLAYVISERLSRAFGKKPQKFQKKIEYPRDLC